MLKMDVIMLILDHLKQNSMPNQIHTKEFTVELMKSDLRFVEMSSSGAAKCFSIFPRDVFAAFKSAPF